MFRPNRFGEKLDILASTTMIVASATLVAIVAARGTNARAAVDDAQLPENPISLVGVQKLGNAAARAVVIEFSDYECPYCSSFATETWPELKTRYVDSGRVRFAFVHLPLDQLHSSARLAAEVAECSGRQGGFWKVHDQIFQARGKLAQFLRDDSLADLVAGLQMNQEAFGKCLVTSGKDEVARQQALAVALGVKSTPTFFLGLSGAGDLVRATERLNGAQPIEQFARALDRILGESTNK